MATLTTICMYCKTVLSRIEDPAYATPATSHGCCTGCHARIVLPQIEELRRRKAGKGGK